MTTLQDEIEARVERCAALLDEKQPDWRLDVDPQKLDMAWPFLTDEGCGCLLAQVFGSYQAGVMHLGILLQEGFYGVELPDDATTYEMLGNAWREYLAR